MAEFRVRYHVAAEGRLPMICMRCGRPATTRKERRMVYKPGWVVWLLIVGILFLPLLLAYLIVALCLEKRCGAFCSRHWTEFKTRQSTPRSEQLAFQD